MVHGRSSLSGQRAALWCLGGPLCLPDGLLCGLWEVLSVHPTRPAAAHGMSFSTHPTRLSVAHGRSSPATQPGSPWSMGGPQPPSQPPPVPCGASRCRDRVILVACGHNHREDTGVTSTPATSSLQQRGGGCTVVPTPGTCSCLDPFLLLPAPWGWCPQGGTDGRGDILAAHSHDSGR